MTQWNEATIKQLGDDHFATHIVDLGVNGDHLLWRRKDGSGLSRVEYTINHNKLIVLGDLGSAVYVWSQELTWAFLADCHYDYFAGKCVASEHGRGFKQWSGSVAIQYIRDEFADLKSRIEDSAGDEHAECVMRLLEEGDVFDSLENSHQWYQWIGADPKRYNEFWESGAIGDQVASRCILHLEGIKRAVEQLRLEGGP